MLFNKNRIYQTLKIGFNHLSSSKNNTGVITNHHFATLPDLQPVHDGGSHKQDIPAKSIQFVTTNNASSNCSCSRPHQWFFTSARNTRNSGTQPIIIPHQPIALGATSEVHWFYGLLINIYYSRLSWYERHHSLENSTHAVSNKWRNSNITADLDTKFRSVNRYTLTTFPEKMIISYHSEIPSPS